MFEGVQNLTPTTNLAALFSSLHESNVRIAVITNDDRGPTESALDRFDIGRYVDFIAGGDGPYLHKPAPDALLAASERLGVAPERTAVVGDAATDLRMADAAGAGLRVGVLTGVGSRKELARSARSGPGVDRRNSGGATPHGEAIHAPARSSDRPGAP